MKGIRAITPYIPGEQPNFPTMIKINTNENPYPPSPKVVHALQTFDASRLKRYSSIDNHTLKNALAKKYGLSPKQFIIGNGSDELLAFCFLAFFNSSDPVLFPDITYGFYKVWADLFHIPFKEIPLSENFAIHFADYAQKNGGIIIANPNAPTGLVQSLDAISDFVSAHQDVMILIDEAYVDFADYSVLPLLEKYPNIILIRTFSKSSALAGLRIGYAIGNPKYIQVLESIKSSFNPYSVDCLAECLATAAVEDSDYYQKITAKICATRDWFIEQLTSLGFQTLPSKTNFVLTTHPEIETAKLYSYLEKHDVFVRYFPSVDRLKNYLRMSIGTQEEMEKVVQLLKKY